MGVVLLGGNCYNIRNSEFLLCVIHLGCDSRTQEQPVSLLSMLLPDAGQPGC